MAVILRSVTESKITYESAKANRLQVQQELKESSVAGTVTQRRQELERQLASLKARQEKLNIYSLKEGKVIDTFASFTKPNSKKIIALIQKEIKN